MANIDITDQGGGSLSNGVLQLENGVAMDTTLRYVADQANTKSQLLLATNATTVEGTLKIKTDNVDYIDLEDGSGNNRFTISRPALGQKVTLDFASNPVGSTTPVGAIRTFQDGVNLSDAMTFIEDGSIGIGTTAPVGLLHMYKPAINVRLAIDGNAGFNRLISYRTGALPRWGLYADNTAESGSNAGTNFAIRRYNDAGTFIDAPLYITRSSGNIGVNTTTTTGAKLNVRGTGATSATSSLIVSSPAGLALDIKDDGKIYGGTTGTRVNFGDSIMIPGNRGFISAGDGVTGIYPGFGSGVFRFTNWVNNYEITWQYAGKTFWIQETTGGTAQASAHLQVDSTTQGFLPPRMTTAQKLAIASPAAGLMVYDTTLNKLCVYTTAWETITSV